MEVRVKIIAVVAVLSLSIPFSPKRDAAVAWREWAEDTFLRTVPHRPGLRNRLAPQRLRPIAALWIRADTPKRPTCIPTTS